jgi:hypothetical protein
MVQAEAGTSKSLKIRPREPDLTDTALWEPHHLRIRFTPEAFASLYRQHGFDLNHGKE